MLVVCRSTCSKDTFLGGYALGSMQIFEIFKILTVNILYCTFSSVQIYIAIRFDRFGGKYRISTYFHLFY